MPSFQEAVVLGDKNYKFSHIFLSINGFNPKEPTKYAPNTANLVEFYANDADVVMYNISSGQKQKPVVSTHNDTHLYYYKRSEHKLWTFELFNGPDRVKYDKVREEEKKRIVKNIKIQANNKPIKEGINEDFINILNEAIAIANEKVKPTPPIDPVMF
uniref:Uncharacterized protein n=1 Tax=viral metagenome TaxID=1070528 RepID=A0A6C0HUX8_9ZZZZ